MDDHVDSADEEIESAQRWTRSVDESPKPFRKLTSKHQPSEGFYAHLTTSELIAGYQSFFKNNRRRYTEESSSDEENDHCGLAKENLSESSDPESISDFEDPESDDESMKEANVHEFVISTKLITSDGKVQILSPEKRVSK